MSRILNIKEYTPFSSISKWIFSPCVCDVCSLIRIIPAEEEKNRFYIADNETKSITIINSNSDPRSQRVPLYETYLYFKDPLSLTQSGIDSILENASNILKRIYPSITAGVNDNTGSISISFYNSFDLKVILDILINKYKGSIIISLFSLSKSTFFSKESYLDIEECIIRFLGIDERRVSTDTSPKLLDTEMIKVIKKLGIPLIERDLFTYDNMSYDTYTLLHIEDISKGIIYENISKVLGYTNGPASENKDIKGILFEKIDGSTVWYPVYKDVIIV